MSAKDLEWGQDTKDAVPPQQDVSAAENVGAVRENELVTQKGPIYRWLSKAFDMGVEARGIERVPEDERDGKHTIGLLLLWWSVNSVVSTVPIGVSWTQDPGPQCALSVVLTRPQLLAQAYYTLTFHSAVAAIVAFTAIGAACCAFIATLGPKTGLRTMVISRYSVGSFSG
jgi:hypothetical protein